MNSILRNSIVDNLPVEELDRELESFMEPVLRRMPEKRWCAVAQMAVRGIVAARSPVLTEAARGISRAEETVWPTVKRLYRFVWSKRFSHRDLLKGLYGIAQRTVARHTPARLLVALDPVNLEKPQCH